MKLDYLVKAKTGNAWRTRYRSPLLSGKIVSQSIHTTDDLEAARVSKALAAMVLDSAWHQPTMYKAAVERFGQRSADAFFGPTFGIRIVSLSVTGSNSANLLLENLTLRNSLTEAHREIGILRAATDGMPIGEAKTVTVGTALARWEKELVCRSESERKLVIHRAKRPTAGVADVKLCQLTLEQVVQSIAASVTNKAPSTMKRTRDVRRFLNWAAETYNIKAVSVLARQLRCQSNTTLARAKDKDILNVVALNRFLSEPGRTAQEIYWQALVATLAYSGVRLSELAGLRWSDVDFDRQLLRIRHGEKQLKTEQSNRAVHGMDELWAWLPRLKAVTGGYSVVFPFVKLNGEFWDRSWLQREGDRWKSKPLTQRLVILPQLQPLGRKIPLRARRFARTEMLSRGVPVHVVDAQMGHSSDVGEAHYTKAEAVVLAFYNRPVVNGLVNGSEGRSATA